MDISSSRLQTKHLVIGGIGLIILQYGLVAASGFKPPSLRGYDSPATQTVWLRQQSPSDQVSLERLLAPPPELEWSKRVELPDLSEIPQSAGPTPPAGDQSGAAAQEEAPASEAPASEAREKVALLSQPAEEKAAAPELAAPLRVQPVYLRTLPDLESLSVSERKQRFIAILLPLVLRSNEELEARRGLILEAVSENDLPKLRQWGQLYGYEPESGSVADYERELLRRVAPVPVSIALAQAAVESGWGTSRFAIHGNALMGEWAWNPAQGIRPSEARRDDMVVRAFGSLFDSVRAYMHNLNSHAAYEEFRAARSRDPEPEGFAEISQLLDQLASYSEKGGDYISTLEEVINSNNLVYYDQAELVAN